MQTHNPTNPWTTRWSVGLVGLLFVWFAAAYLIGTEQLLVSGQHTLIPPIALTAALPVIAFLVAYGLSTRFRNFVLAQDVRILTALQHWRVIGFAFLPLYFFGVLPGLFAWPAGLGDIAIGIGAAFVVARINRDPNYVTSSGFLTFHLMGLLDFTVAIVTSGLASGVFPGLIEAGITSAPLDVWPLNLFPSFIVPIFIILQVSALLKARHLRRAARQPLTAAVEAA